MEPKSNAHPAETELATPFKTSPTVPSNNLLSLPDELLLLIIDEVSLVSQSLCALARTCTRLTPLCESKLYQSIFLLSGCIAALLTSSLKAKQCRATYISTLDMRIRPQRVENMQLLTPQLMAMEKLKDWTIESPYCNVNSWRHAESDRWQNDISAYVEIFRAASLLAPPKSSRLLPMLQSFKLISNGLRKEFWDLGHLKVIFLHPSLRNIHLASANIHVEPHGDNVDNYAPYAKSTLLRNLTLEECHVSAEGLKAILSLPKALQRLTIEEMNFSAEDGPRNFNHLTAHPAEFIASLEQQKESLEFLRHVPTNRIYRSNLVLSAEESRSGFSQFTQLSRIDLVESSALRFLLRPDLAPPNLVKLRLETREKLHNIDMFLLTRPSNMVIQHAKSISSLLSIDILIWGMSGYKNSIWPKDEQFREIHRLALELSAQGKHMSLFANQGEDIHFVPPYLYGEQKPTEVLVYDPNYSFRVWEAPYTSSFKGLSPDDLSAELLDKFKLHTWSKLATLFEPGPSDDEESEEGEWLSDSELESEYFIDMDGHIAYESDIDFPIGGYDGEEEEDEGEGEDDELLEEV